MGSEMCIRDRSEEEARKTAQMVALSAMKYGDLSNQAAKDYVFDVERFISFEGIQDRTIYIRLCVSNQFLQNMQKVEKMQPSAR